MNIAEKKERNQKKNYPKHTFIEITNTRDVVLSMLANDIATVADDDGRVPDGVVVLLVTLEDGGDDDHVVLGGQIGQEARGAATEVRWLGELAPELLLPRAEREGHRPCLLQTQDVYSSLASDIDDLPDLLFNPFISTKQSKKKKEEEEEMLKKKREKGPKREREREDFTY